MVLRCPVKLVAIARAKAEWLGYDISGAWREIHMRGGSSEYPMHNQLTSHTDEDAGVVYIVGHGFWNDDIVTNHFLELRRTVQLARRRVQCLKVLVDLRDAAVQSPAVAAKIKAETRMIWTEADRIAVVLQSALAKMQINRVVDSGNHASFVVIEDARRWLGL